MIDISNAQSNWQPPENWITIRTIDSHAEGEPLRVIVDGYPELSGETMLDRRTYALKNYEYLRTALMWEPRGHADMYGCIITPPVSEEADFGVLFMHNEGYSTMCGHGIIAVTTVVLETGMMPITEPETVIRIDTPSGMVTSHARIKEGRVDSVYFHNVPSFVLALDETVEVPDIGSVKYDIAFGGAFYAFVDADSVGLGRTPEHLAQIIETGMKIKRAVASARPMAHPFRNELNFLYGTIFTSPPLGEGADTRNVCVFAEGEVDRSPTGTGVSGLLAIHRARDELDIGEPLVVESIIGSRFTGIIISELEFGDYKAIIPEVGGSASITGRSEFYLDPDDPLKEGFILR